MYVGMSHLVVFLIKLGLMNAGGVGLVCGYLTFMSATDDPAEGPLIGVLLGITAIVVSAAFAMAVEFMVCLFIYATFIAW